ncbi:MAG TPA: hypothetical protein VKL22_05400, partial [Actinomycetota bacterium]|nr:hypothetical protein [Actinomycetota bacterium]
MSSSRESRIGSVLGAAAGALSLALLMGTAFFSVAASPGEAARSAKHSQVSTRNPGHAPRGYWLAAANGGVFSYGAASFRGAVSGAISHPVVGMATTPLGNGYWLVASDGGVFSFGLPFLGSTGAIKLNKPVVGIAASPLGNGYWLVASDGGVFNYGVPFQGSTGSLKLNKPIVGMAATPTGGGYWLVASDGGVFSFGDAGFFGSMGGTPLAKPIVGMATTPTGNGYWLVASDGGVFSFGDAAFLGSLGGTPGVKPAVGISPTPSGRGYWLVASDGGVFSYGDAAFFGSAGSLRLVAPVVGVMGVPNTGPGKVGAFYYSWYDTPSGPTGDWRHWSQGGHLPPGDIGSSYYPVRGPYSSADSAVVDAQMAEIAAAGVNQVIVSWWGQGSFEDSNLPLIQRLASSRGLEVAVILEPYGGRDAAGAASGIAYLTGRGISTFYVYQAVSISSSDWATIRAQYPKVTLFAHSGSPGFVRAGNLAAFAAAGGFDGIFTYDPYAYQASDFPAICAQARAALLQCAPSVSPGYDATRATADSRVRDRNGGVTYDSTWQGAITAAPEIVTITSYNEWHEGSQIEPAMPFCVPN